MTLLDLLPSLRAAVTPRVDPALWPHTTHVDEAGRLTVGGVALADIADETGTPTHVIDEADFRHRARRYRKELPGTTVVYAGQALLTTAVARWAAEEHLGVDVGSVGELTTSLGGGVPRGRIVYHGVAKTHDDLRAAVQAGVGRIVVDSLMDITYLAGLVRTTQSVLVRVASRHSDCGFPVGPEVAAAVANVVTEPKLRLVGLHCHIGSQVSDAEQYGAAIRAMIGTMADVRRAHRLVLGELNIGGGHCVPHFPGDRELALRHLAAEADDALDAACAAERFPRPTIVVEPGRAMAARAGVTLYRVLSVTTRAGGSTFVAVDGPLTDAAPCTATLANRRPMGPSRPMVVVGSGGVIRDAELPEDIRHGDLMAVACTGAYHHRAAVHGLVGRPPLVSVRDGRLQTLVRRETLADLMARDRG
jgi:diaminopimelate decarboxylase